MNLPTRFPWVEFYPEWNLLALKKRRSLLLTHTVLYVRLRCLSFFVDLTAFVGCMYAKGWGHESIEVTDKQIVESPSQFYLACTVQYVPSRIITIRQVSSATSGSEHRNRTLPPSPLPSSPHPPKTNRRCSLLRSIPMRLGVGAPYECIPINAADTILISLRVETEK